MPGALELFKNIFKRPEENLSSRYMVGIHRTCLGVAECGRDVAPLSELPGIPVSPE
jgi:hypothetical protein